ncbi:DUF1361 domain-containing protein [Leptolyngbya sp. AN02str]|uniref:DUF1361 domain-containing protein n=1 Tax=Leptolyngbya sp. AN02str TaxID=3423363 RepID=UPI003D318B2F
MEARIERALQGLLSVYNGWILWNLFLAFIPLALSFWLFRYAPPRRNFVWWSLFVVFIAFLPNAPYMLTDIIHLIRGTQRGYDAWAIALLVIPLHVSAILSGFEAYVIALINQSYYLKQQGVKHWISVCELLTHALCAIGIYLGRFRRYNSWDLVTEPGTIFARTLDDLTSQQPIVVMLITFLILTVLYWIMKQITLGLYLRYRFTRLGDDGLG